MNGIYITSQGDSWDIISKKVYGSEQYADYIMKANLRLIDIVIFDAGFTIWVPELKVENETLPEWREDL